MGDRKAIPVAGESSKMDQRKARQSNILFRPLIILAATPEHRSTSYFVILLFKPNYSASLT